MSTALVRKGTAPSRHVYDVLIIGGQLGGALAAALFAKRGLQVLYVPHDGLGQPYAHGEARLPHAPFFMPPIKAVPAFDEALQELGINAAVGRLVHPASLQVLEQDRWYELTHDEKRRGPELARAFGGDAETFDELMRKAQSAAEASDSFFQAHPDLPPEGFFGRWKFKRSLTRFPGLGLDTPLATDAIIRKLTPFVTSLEGASPLSRARALGRALAGPAVITGGREALWSALTDRARELGADVLAADEPVERIALDGSTVGVRLSKGDTTYRAGFMVAAMDLDVLTRLMPEKSQKSAAKVLPAVTAQKALVTLNLVLPENALPRGLGPLALVDAPQLDGGALLLQLSPGPKPDERVLTVSVQASTGLRAGGEPAVRALLTQVHAAMARVMPFTKQHVTLESSPWIDAAPIVAGRAEVHPLLAAPPTGWLGVSALTTSAPWKRVMLASRQVLPGLGFEGEVLASQRAVKRVELALKKNDPLRRKTA